MCGGEFDTYETITQLVGSTRHPPPHHAATHTERETEMGRSVGVCESELSDAGRCCCWHISMSVCSRQFDEPMTARMAGCLLHGRLSLSDSTPPPPMILCQRQY